MMPVKESNSGVVTTIADDDLVMCHKGQWSPIKFADFMKAVRGGIQVGGRNLLTGTRDWSLGWANQGSHTIGPDKYRGLSILHYGNNVWQGLNQSISHLAGKKCMLSFYCKVSTTGTFVFRLLTVIETISKTLAFSMDKANEWVRLTCSVDIPTDVSQLRVEVGTGTAKGLCLCGVKLEEGNIVTDWMPAPEDSWGGVIGCYAINYDSAEKGGAHDGQDACGDARLCADGHLAFGSLDALEEFVECACSGWADERESEVGDDGCVDLSGHWRLRHISEARPRVGECIKLDQSSTRRIQVRRPYRVRESERLSNSSLFHASEMRYVLEDVLQASQSAGVFQCLDKDRRRDSVITARKEVAYGY